VALHKKVAEMGFAVEEEEEEGRRVEV